MPVIFNIDEGVKRSDFGILEEPIKLAIINKAEPFEKNSLIKEYFLLRKTDKFEEKFRSEGRTMGEFKLADDLDEYPIDDNGEGFAKSFGVVEWKNGFVVSQQLKEDGDVNAMRRLAVQLTKGFYRGREYFARDMIVGGLSGKYAHTRLNGAVKNFDCTTLDSIDGSLTQAYKVPLFSVAHRLPENHFKVGGKPVVQSNKFGVIGGIDPSEVLAVEKVKDLLGQIRAHGLQFVGEDGKTAGYRYNKILIPTFYRLKWVIEQAIKDDSSWTLIEDEYLDGKTGFTEADRAFLVTSSEALSDTEGAILNDRIPLTIKSYIENKNDANVWAGRARYGAGFISYRHIAYVSLKNIGLVTTSVGTFTLNGQAISDIATIANRGGIALKGYYLATAAADVATELELNNCFYAFSVVAHGKPVEVVTEVKAEITNGATNPVSTQEVSAT